MGRDDQLHVHPSRKEDPMSGVWPFVGGVIGVILLVVVVFTFVDLFRRHLGAGPTAGWAIVVLLLPFIGSAVYWARREPSRPELEYQVESERAMRESARRQPFDSTGIR
jgi:phospholipase D-like protein